VLTDFDENALVTKTEASAPVYKGKTVSLRSGKGLSVEIQDAIRDATEISATAVKQALEAVKEGLENSKLSMDEARRQVEEARRNIERARSDSDRQRRDAERATASARRRDSSDAKPAPAPPAPGEVASAWATPPAPALFAKFPAPTISGGKLVTGTLNGGGPEISVSTMNGDVVVRKLEASK